ncbi:ComEC/Rec2 family competence protein [Caldovatus aquaticus]|uniref:ComEC/Rec2 family competence protein n=1 Tax=Caldovatus aquaticus TaxID=2865671 RepID=A0ABS7F2W4_9PROT|nr:ComEC/Rec2 family competence protein [Caldovatus aquaticus]MBW8269332.1 ComEC/Rec2 family competence protein [Caldovatus aquaticus]
MSGVGTLARGPGAPPAGAGAGSPARFGAPLPLRRPAAALSDRLAAERGRLALWLPVALGAGILLYFGLRSEPSPAWRWLPLPPLAGALLLAARRPHLAWGVGLLAAAARGGAGPARPAARLSPPLAVPARAVVVAGIVESVALLPQGRRVTLAEARLLAEAAEADAAQRASSEAAPPLPRLVRVRLRSDDPARPMPGDRVTVRALLRPPAAPAYPGAWDFQRAAFFSGLGASGFALGPASVEPGAGRAPPLAALRARIEARAVAAIPGEAGAVAAALLTGGQSAIPPTALAAMRDSGLAHLLSVSGLHLAIVMGVAFAVVRLFAAALPAALALRISAKGCAAVAALAAGGFYMILAGAEVPMRRSFAMAALVTLGILLGRRALSLRGLALAAAALLLLDPVQLLGPSFQMSFAAVLALVAGWEWVRPRLAAARLARAESGWAGRLAGRALVWLAGGVATSLLAGAATTPFGLHHFGRLQLYGVAANAVAVPLTSVLVMPAGMAAVALMPFGLEGLALAPMGWGVEAILAVARTVASWPGAALALPPLPAWGLAATAFGMVWLCLWRTGWRALGVPAIVLGLSSGAFERPPDLLVSADARLIALRVAGDGGGAFVQRLAGGSAFTRDAMLRAWGVEGGAQAQPFPESGEAAGGAIRCTPAACLLRPREGTADALLVRAAPRGPQENARHALLEEACAGGAAVVVAAEPLRMRCRGAAVIDRFRVWRDGPHAVWLERDGARVVSDRAFRGARPWVPPPPRPRAPAEPPAPTE